MLRRWKRSWKKHKKFYITLLITYLSMWLLTTYPFIILLTIISATIIFLSKFFIKRNKEKKILKSNIKVIDYMTGIEFENYLEQLFKDKGYKVSKTAISGDYGADLVLQKNNVKTVVQAKRYKGNVGIKSVQEVIGAKGYYKAKEGIVITNSYYTNNALNLAKSNGIDLWDREQLMSESIKIQEKYKGGRNVRLSN